MDKVVVIRDCVETDCVYGIVMFPRGYDDSEIANIFARAKGKALERRGDTYTIEDIVDEASKIVGVMLSLDYEAEVYV